MIFFGDNYDEEEENMTREEAYYKVIDLEQFNDEVHDVLIDKIDKLDTRVNLLEKVITGKEPSEEKKEKVEQRISNLEDSNSQLFEKCNCLKNRADILEEHVGKKHNEKVLAAYLKSVNWDDTIDYKRMSKHIVELINDY